MNELDHIHILTKATDVLANIDSYHELFHQQRYGEPLPSQKDLSEVIDITRAILFPGYFGHSNVKLQTLKYHIGVNIEKLYNILRKQIAAGLCFEGCNHNNDCIEKIRTKSSEIAAEFIQKLPEIRAILATDVKAAYEGDPAAQSISEVICCYPAIRAISNYRIANALLKLNVPLIPRIISEMAHSETGIDIHPAANIGECFTIDHGTGVVIGATSIIGNHVKIYQGVTLGARSFPLDENGQPIKGIDRHPIIEDNVIIYSNATVLGRIIIGRDSVIGANMWITESIAPKTKLYQK